MVCLVTGSSRGLGKEIALSFGSRGHRVVVHCKDRKKEGEEVASRINESITLQADVRDYHEVKALINKVIHTWGRVDVLVNNAGISNESLMMKTSESRFDDVIKTNLNGPFHFIRAAARHMMKQKNGHIINISSFAGVKGKEGLSAYSASKSGLIGLTKTAARELARYNILVNAVLPGYMLTDMGTGSTDKVKEAALGQSLIKEFSDPHRVAELILHLSEMKGLTGQVFNLDSRII